MTHKKYLLSVLRNRRTWKEGYNRDIQHGGIQTSSNTSNKLSSPSCIGQRGSVTDKLLLAWICVKHFPPICNRKWSEEKDQKVAQLPAVQICGMVSSTQFENTSENRNSWQRHNNPIANIGKDISSWLTDIDIDILLFQGVRHCSVWPLSFFLIWRYSVFKLIQLLRSWES